MNLADRYSRNQNSITTEEQGKLARSTVAIVGCGGLGGYIAEELARLGVGHLILIDGDRFEVSNLNRQLMSTEHNLGEWKVEAARERLKYINSNTKVTIFKEQFEELKGMRMFEDADVVCDALDSLVDRVMLEHTCHQLGKPLVFSSIGGWCGMIGVSLPGDFSVATLYGQRDRGVESTLGNPVFTPAVMASLNVAETVKILLGRPVSLRRTCLFVNLKSMIFERFEILP